MTIASAIVAKQQQVADAYTACDNKGATMPGTQNLTNLANCIGTIPTGGGGSPVITSLTVAPSTSAQTITAPSGTDGYSPVYVNAVTAAIDSNITAGNIKSGVSILGVAGSVVELNGETRSVAITSTAGNTFTPSSGKNAITSITVTPTNQARTVNPSTSSQSLSVNSGYSGNGTITVNPVTSSIDANITAGNIKKDVEILGVTGTYEGGSTPTGRYQLLERIKEDNHILAIGTVGGFFTDANGIEYAIVCLDSDKRLLQAAWCSSATAVTNMPYYANNVTAYWYTDAKETAKQNGDYLKAYCDAKGYTSQALTWCRNQTYTIGGTLYTAQLPNIVELFEIWKHRAEIQALDRYGDDLDTSFATRHNIWSSTQAGSGSAWCLNQNGYYQNAGKANTYMACPILEIPNAL